MSCSNQIICYTSPHLSLHVPFFFLLVILTHCYVIVNSFYYPPLQAYLQYKKSLSNIIHLSHRQIQIFCCFQSLRKTGIYFNLYSFSNLRCLITINGNGMITPPIINTISNTSTGITNPNQKPSSIHMP